MARVKVRYGERLDRDSVKEVHTLLSADKPISKKVACAKLNISYNTTRLAKIIDEYLDNLAYSKKMRNSLRSKPITKEEASTIVASYLDNDSLSYISETTFRSVAKIKYVLEQYNIPLRGDSDCYTNPPMIMDSALTKDYKEGDLVYVVKYDSPAYIRKLIQVHAEHGNVYGMYLVGTRRMNVSQPWYELSDMRKVQDDLNVNLYDLSAEEVQEILRETIKRVNKRGSK